ncbi:DMT family transporter [Corallincola luteus]|uniref:DMT family transporter n=1 Tax=Corallincola luteus TaxID=1775177 RepID=UPI00196B4D3D|nr:DMT family transporter [Corallincola luteus]
MEAKTPVESNSLLIELRTVALTSLALLAFAANSLLCRQALAPAAETAQAMDPYSFTLVRLFSGAVMLAVLTLLRRWLIERRASLVSACPSKDSKALSVNRSWLRRGAALWLALYALGFSLAYVELGAALGALILFATVQFTLMTAALVQRESLSKRQWLGFLFALAGFVWLVLPAVTKQSDASNISFIGVGLMVVAGIAWGFYTLAGRGSLDPLKESRDHFAASLLWIVLVALIFVLFASLWLDEITIHINLDDRGLYLAVASGALASGVGYALWYQALRYLQGSQAAVSQLLVPILAAIGAALWLQEPITQGLITAGSLVLLGIALMTVKSKP